MILSKYGVELHTMKESEIELVRYWRNQSFVRKRMFHSELISTSDQIKWFKNLSENDLYFIIESEATKIGVINVKSIDWEKREGEAGIFIGDEKYLNSHISMLAILTLMDYFLEDFSFNKLKACVRSDNMEALHFNQELGYSIDKKERDSIQLSVTKESYSTGKSRLKSLLNKVNIQSGKSHFSEEEEKLLFLK